MSIWSRALFEDRADAGKRLAERLAHLKADAPIVAGMVRGGIPVAAEIARALHAPLIPIIVQKIGAPGQPELAMGAIVDGPAPEVVWNEDIVEAVHASGSSLAIALKEAQEQLASRRRRFATAAGGQDIAGRTVIVVDDGIATGASVRAALSALRRAGPKSIVLAVPVVLVGGRPFAGLADETVALAEPAGLSSVGSAYVDFGQVTDAEVLADLAQLRTNAA